MHDFDSFSCSPGKPQRTPRVLWAQGLLFCGDTSRLVNFDFARCGIRVRTQPSEKLRSYSCRRHIAHSFSPFLHAQRSSLRLSCRHVQGHRLRFVFSSPLCVHSGSIMALFLYEAVVQVCLAGNLGNKLISTRHSSIGIEKAERQIAV